MDAIESITKFSSGYLHMKEGPVPERLMELLSYAAIVFGILLFLWVLGIRPIKELDVKLTPRPKLRLLFSVTKSLLAVLLLAGGCYGLKQTVFHTKPQLLVLTGLAENEYRVFQDIVSRFPDATVRVEDIPWQQVSLRLGQEPKVDLITFDINGWHKKLVDQALLEDLTNYKGLIPSTVHPALVRHLETDGRRYLIPFRPNARLVFWNSEMGKKTSFPEKGPRTWNDVATLARELHKQDGEVRVAVQATENDAPLFLLELLRSAGVHPLYLADTRALSVGEFLYKLWPCVSEKSEQADWLTTSGLLLTYSVHWARNWTFALSRMNEAGVFDETNGHFEVYTGLSWNDDSKPHSLLGGEYLAVPQSSPNKSLAIELVRFLVGQDTQADIVSRLSWPAMRLDAVSKADQWQRTHLDQINETLVYAQPVPDYWWPELEGIYRRMFYRLVSVAPGGVNCQAADHNDKGEDRKKILLEILRDSQAAVDRLGLRGRELLLTSHWLPPYERFPERWKSVMDLLQMTESACEPYSSLGWAKLRFERDWEGAKSDLERAVQNGGRDPGCVDARRRYAYLLAAQGLISKGRDQMRQVLSENPDSAQSLLDLGWMYYLEGNYDEARSYFERSQGLNRDSYLPWLMIARATIEEAKREDVISDRRAEEAITAAKTARSLAVSGKIPSAGSIPSSISAALAEAYSLSRGSDDRAKAREVAKSMEAGYERTHASPIAIAAVYTALGETDKAINWLDVALRDNEGDLIYLKVDPRFEPLCKGPRGQDNASFQRLLREVYGPGDAANCVERSGI